MYGNYLAAKIILSERKKGDPRKKFVRLDELSVPTR